jgi:NADH-quinone oxidoreductase subunit E
MLIDDMLTEQELRDIEEEVAHSPTPRSVCVDALMIIRKHRGWVSDEAVADLAETLQMTKSEVENVATFYNLIFRKPVGRHVIMVCDSISCFIMGEERLADHLKRKLGIEFGETTSDGMFTLLPTVCLGHCDIAPVMMLDGEIIGHLTEAKIDSILARIIHEQRE